MSAASYGFSYGFLGIQALRGEISVAEFVMCVTAVETLSHGCLLPIINLSQQFVVKSNFMRAFIEFMDLEDQNWMGRCGIGAQDLEEIRFDHVSFQYPGSEQFIIKDISFRIRRGEHISLVGVNGAGKSTLVKLICRLYEPTEGVIYVNGRDIREYDYEEYITLLAVVFQDFKLWGYSLDQNICVAEHLPDGYRQKREALYRASGLIDWVSTLSQGGETILSKEFDEEGTEPSGGLAQKIAIARALYRGAPFLILDEPTAALDPVSEYEIYKRFHEMIKNKTAIYISHRLSSCKFCDRILVIQDRKVREEGTHEELMAKKGIYEKMFSAQAKWYT